MNTCCSVINLAFLLYCLDCWNCLPVDLSAPLWLTLCLYEKNPDSSVWCTRSPGSWYHPSSFIDLILCPLTCPPCIHVPDWNTSPFLLNLHQLDCSFQSDHFTSKSWKLLQVYHPFLSTPHGPDYSSLTTSSENSLGLFHLSILQCLLKCLEVFGNLKWPQTPQHKLLD